MVSRRCGPKDPPVGQHVSDVSWRRPQRYDRAEQEIHGHRGVRRLHLGHPRLTGAQAPSQLGLGQVVPPALFAERGAERELALDEGVPPAAARTARSTGFV